MLVAVALPAYVVSVFWDSYALTKYYRIGWQFEYLDWVSAQALEPRVDENIMKIKFVFQELDL